ncbi:MAG: 3-dehydroquinate synthase [Verrucomicrobiales bacterium]
MNSVSVNLDSRSYEILVASHLLDRAGDFIQALKLSGRVAIISDTNVAPRYLERLKNSLTQAGYESSSHLIPAGEASKSMNHAEQLARSMMQAHHDRSSFVIALGGGVVGDLAGFVSSIFYRGIPFVQIPTTIVSQVDSAVGGKTGVNTPEGKNLIGSFQQPRLVLIDPDTLLSLPGREYREGFAEVIKHAAIRDAAMLDELEALDPGDQHTPADLIARNVAIKARIVEEDEKETSGTRALLNFGHTIGHGIEAAVPYGTLLHGEAISLGIRAALILSQKFAGLPAADSQRLINLLKRFQLPVTLSPQLKTNTILEKIARDKKFAGGKLRFVLLSKLGEATLSEGLPLDSIPEAIEELRSPA